MKSFTPFFIYLSFPVLFFQSCMIDVHSSSINGNGHIVSKEFAITDYTEIQSSGMAEIVYEQTIREPYLQVNVDENILPLLEITVEDHVLVVKDKRNGNIQPSRFKIYTNSSNLEKIKFSGRGKVRLQGEVNSKNMKISLSGSGGIVADSLYCERFDASITGSGSIRLTGGSNDSKLNVTGSGSIKGSDFSIRNLESIITGSGNIQVTVGESLKATVTGSGNLHYHGDPKTVETKVTGSGKIESIRNYEL